MEQHSEITEAMGRQLRIKTAITIPNGVSMIRLLSGAIIGDGDRKRAPFLVLGLAP